MGVTELLSSVPVIPAQDVAEPPEGCDAGEGRP
jgi:hypothetical protein